MNITPKIAKKGVKKGVKARAPKQARSSPPPAPPPRERRPARALKSCPPPLPTALRPKPCRPPRPLKQSWTFEPPRAPPDQPWTGGPASCPCSSWCLKCSRGSRRPRCEASPRFSRASWRYMRAKGGKKGVSCAQRSPAAPFPQFKTHLLRIISACSSRVLASVSISDILMKRGISLRGQKHKKGVKIEPRATLPPRSPPFSNLPRPAPRKNDRFALPVENNRQIYIRIAKKATNSPP